MTETEDKKKIKIAFVSYKSSNDINAWSGTIYYIYNALKRNYGDVEQIETIKIPFYIRAMVSIIAHTVRIVNRKGYRKSHSIIRCFYVGIRLSKLLRKKKYDIVFAPAASSEIAFLKTKAPIYYLIDTTFSQQYSYYRSFFNTLSNLSKFETQLIEKKAIVKSKKIICATNWAEKYILEKYNIDKNNIHVIKFGANLTSTPNREIINLKLLNRNTCKLLFVGTNWERKGGRVAFDAFRELLKMGIDTSLTVIGCDPSNEISHPKLTIIPYINKNDEADYKRYLQILSEVHFLILPTKTECFGIVFCEASSFGVPSLTLKTGGTVESVINGLNGYCLPYNSDGKQFALIVDKVFKDYNEYKSIVYRSRDLFEKELNWSHWGKKVKEIL